MKTKNLLVSLDLLNDKVQFNGLVEDQAPIKIDYVAPLGDGQGYTSLELLLLSLGSCMASTLLMFLRRSGKTVNSLRIIAEADRRAEHPTILTTIHLRFFFTSPDLTQGDFEKVLAVTEDRFCPVYAMIKPETKIITTCHIGDPVDENVHSNH